MHQIILREVTKENWLQAIELAVWPEQGEFVSSASIALAKCYIRPEGLPVVPYAIYADEQMVGFFTYTYQVDSTHNYWINSFLIDQAYQGQGYGRAAFDLILKLARQKFPKCQSIGLTVNPANKNAQHIYQSYGFQDTGDIYDDELVYRLILLPL